MLGASLDTFSNGKKAKVSGWGGGGEKPTVAKELKLRPQNSKESEI
jgi:hypothetical protein